MMMMMVMADSSLAKISGKIFVIGGGGTSSKQKIMGQKWDPYTIKTKYNGTEVGPTNRTEMGRRNNLDKR